MNKALNKLSGSSKSSDKFVNISSPWLVEDNGNGSTFNFDFSIELVNVGGMNIYKNETKVV